VKTAAKASISPPQASNKRSREEEEEEEEKSLGARIINSPPPPKRGKSKKLVQTVLPFLPLPVFPMKKSTNAPSGRLLRKQPKLKRFGSQEILG
jgi:hypothetical protein